MDIATWALLQLLSYGIGEWLILVLIAFCAARYGGCGLVFVGHLVVTALVVVFDICWVQKEMSKPGWDGLPDMDFIFYIGVFGRILLVNTVLLPVSAMGIWLRQRKRVPRAPIHNG